MQQYIDQKEKDENAKRVVAFIEHYDKKLEEAGYTHAQRCSIIGILWDSRVVLNGDK